LDFSLSPDNKPQGWEEVRGHRSSPWLVTCPRCSLEGALELVPTRALSSIEAFASLSSRNRARNASREKHLEPGVVS
jgi:hypothetical protein